MYLEKELVRIAKRENNNKRKYLVVNALQGKHIPVSPHKAFDMFNELANIVDDEYKNESLLLIGFAETATAIGAYLATKLNTYYMQTTREIIEGVDYLFFTEAHSHATEQKLVKNDIDLIVNKIQRIIFVEDEITTGNTILNIINILEKKYYGKLQFSVVSLLNGMDNDALDCYAKRGIKVHYLVKTNHSKYTEIAEHFSNDGIYYQCDSSNPVIKIKDYKINNYLNSRRCVKGIDYQKSCESAWEQINKLTNIESNKNILVIGTEEFMYPALYVANKFEEKNNNVKCHSTTRSPIVVSEDKNYPLNKRFELVSFYDDKRKTYIYDIGSYDKVLIITDSQNCSSKGLNSLINALCCCGNKDINIFRWCK